MSRIITDERHQLWLFPPSIDDLIPAEHPARLIYLLVKEMDLEEMGFEILSTDGAGGVKYDEKILIRLYIYAYYRKVTSYRAIEQLARENLGAIWLVGNSAPDHNTIWRFYTRNKKALKEIFKMTVKISIRMGLVDFALQAVDGTKITADVSKQKALHKADLTKILEILEESIEAYSEELEDSKSEHKSKVDVQIPHRIKGLSIEEATKLAVEKMQEEEKIALRDKVHEKMQDLEEQDTNHLSPTDPDARIMKNQEGSRFGFNGQAVVDSKCGIIVAEDVTNRVNDTHELTKMLEKTSETTGVLPENLTIVADGGYFSGRELFNAESKGFNNVLVNVSPATRKKLKNPFHQHNFTYDAENDVYHCPYGGNLKFMRKSKDKKTGIISRRYQCVDFKDCPYRDKCSKDKTGRKIKVGPEEYRQARKRNLQRIQEPENIEKLRKRNQIVEHTFGEIKRILGFRRWTVRGLDNVRAQWAMLCSIVNLKKIYKVWALAVS